jgi:hypothetical protein
MPELDVARRESLGVCVFGEQLPHYFFIVDFHGEGDVERG